MEEISNEIKFNFVVPYNNAYMVATRKKQKQTTGILMILCTLFFGSFAVMSAFATNSAPWVTAVFSIAAVFCAAYVVYLFCSTKPNSKDDKKSISYTFYTDFLDVNQEDAGKMSRKNLTRCLYRSYKNKQYVASITERNNTFEIKIYTGTYNMVPQYKKHTVPKDIIKAEEMEAFKEFLKQNLGKDYLIKQ